MSNIFKKTLVVLCLITVSPVVAAPGGAAKAEVSSGPKVHTSKVEDQSGCDKLTDPQAAALGRTAGAVAGMKLGAGMSGSMMAAAAAEEAAVRATTAGRCSAKVDIGQAAQQPLQKIKNKIKLKIPGLGF